MTKITDKLEVDEILRAVRNWIDYDVKEGDLYKTVSLSGNDLILVERLVNSKNHKFYIWVDEWHAQSRNSDIGPLFDRFT